MSRPDRKEPNECTGFRNRIHSEGGIEEYLKRKRAEAEEKEVEEQIVFNKSKKTARSPFKTTEKGKSNIEQKDQVVEMEELRGMLKEMFGELKKEIRENSEKMEKNNEDVMKLSKQIQKREKEWREEREEWKREREEWRKEKDLWKEEGLKLENKIKNLERQMEMKERRERKNNLIIKGVEFSASTEQALIGEAVGVIEKEMGLTPAIKRAHGIGNNQIIVQLNSLESKISILKNKFKLEGTAIYIDSDLTKQERTIQGEIRKKAKEEKEKGNLTKVGYQKLKVGNNWYRWNEETNNLEPEQEQKRKNPGTYLTQKRKGLIRKKERWKGIQKTKREGEGEKDNGQRNGHGKDQKQNQSRKN